MDNFICSACNYSTSRQANYTRHINSRIHYKKVEVDPNTQKMSSNGTQMEPKWNPNGTSKTVIDKTREYQCTYCNNMFSGANSLARHKKSCSNKLLIETNYKDQITQLNLKLEQLEKDNDRYKDESKYFQEENKYHKRLLNEVGGLVKKSVSALTYVVHNYDNAPTIEMLDVEDMEDLEENNKKLAEDVISAYKHKTLDKYLGDSIIKLYKKDNPADQSIWSTDTSRLTYLIKELMVNDSSSWIIDKKGIKTKEYLIDPLMEHIKELIIYYQKNSMTLSTNIVEIEFVLETNKRILKLVNDIDDGYVSNNLLKYISAHLFFNDKLLK